MIYLHIIHILQKLTNESKPTINYYMLWSDGDTKATNIKHTHNACTNQWLNGEILLRLHCCFFLFLFQFYICQNNIVSRWLPHNFPCRHTYIRCSLRSAKCNREMEFIYCTFFISLHTDIMCQCCFFFRSPITLARVRFWYVNDLHTINVHYEFHNWINSNIVLQWANHK